MEMQIFHPTQLETYQCNAIMETFSNQEMCIMIYSIKWNNESQYFYQLYWIHNPLNYYLVCWSFLKKKSTPLLWFSLYEIYFLILSKLYFFFRRLYNLLFALLHIIYGCGLLWQWTMCQPNCIYYHNLVRLF